MRKVIVHIGRGAITGAMMLLLAACGGGGGSDTTKKESKKSVALASCGANEHIASYTQLRSGDVIKKTKANTHIRVYHFQDGRRFVCVKSGEAILLR